MFMLLMVVLSVVIVAVIAVLVKGNESLKAQHREYVVAVNTVYDNHSNVIIGLQGEIEALLAKRADDQEIIAAKDLHIAGLVEELKKATEQVAILEKKATEQVAILEKLATKKEAELAEATASEFTLKAKLANAVANYAKVEAYALKSMKKSSPSIFGDCNPRLGEKFIFEDELNINWFK